MNKLVIQDLLEYKPRATYGNKQYDYITSFYCDTNKIIHPNLNQVLHCSDCVTSEDKILYAAKQRMNYPIHNFFGTPTEDICTLHEIKIKYFKPWL